MKHSFLRFAIYTLSVIFSLPAFSEQIRIFGTVKDDQGQPIELATVRVKNQIAMTTTNLKGGFSLHCARRDTIEVICSMIGYQTRKRLLYSPTDSIRVDFVLPLYGGYSIGEAVVKGQGVQTGTVQRIKPVDSNLMPSTTGNGVEEIIATQAGVSTHNELSSQYNVRGGSFDENCVYINGVEVYRPLLISSGQQEGLSIINPNMVEAIGFSSGGFEAKYADRMSSVLDITYKRPEKFEASANASLLGAGVYVGWGNKKVSLMSSVRYKTTSYLLGSLDTDGEYSPNFLDYQAVLSWTPRPKWTVDIMGNISNNHYNFEPEDRETKFGTMQDAKTFKVYFDGQEKDQFRTYFGSFTLTHHFNPQTYLALQTSTFSTKEAETYDIQGEYWLNEATGQQQLGVGTYMEHARNRLQAHVVNAGLTFRTKITAHTLQAGLNWQREEVKEHAREWEMRDSMGYSLPHNPERLELIYSQQSNNHITSNRLQAYAQDTWRIRSDIGLFNLTYGVRLSHWDWNGETLLSPRASLGLLPSFSDHWTFRLATGFYYQSPFYKELKDTTLKAGIATVELNKNIRSQKSIHLVLGADYTFRMAGRPFKFTAEAYYKALSHLIPYTVDGVRINYSGGKTTSGYAAGLDFKLFGEFVPGTDSWLTFSILSTKEKHSGHFIPRPTDQRYNLSLYFTDYFPGTTRWRFTLKAAIADGLPFGPAHADRSKYTFRAPSYKRADIGMSYRLVDENRPHPKFPYIKNAWIGLDVFNLLDINNVSSYYWVTDITQTRYAVPNYLTGRQINLRLSIDF